MSYLLNSPYVLDVMHAGKSDMARANLSLGFFRDLVIPLPPLEEQRRIVEILDRAFEGLARARENAEAKLKSASELFECLLTHTHCSSVIPRKPQQNWERSASWPRG